MKMQQQKEEDDDNDPWIMIENEYATVVNQDQWDEEAWIVMPNPLVEDLVTEQEFKDLEGKEVEFALPFYISEDEDSDQDVVDKPQALHELTSDLFGTRINNIALCTSNEPGKI
jgi:hypothetical protein